MNMKGLERRVIALENRTGNADCSALQFVTVTRGVDGILRDLRTGEAVPDDPPIAGVPCGEFRFLTTLDEIEP